MGKVGNRKGAEIRRVLLLLLSLSLFVFGYAYADSPTVDVNKSFELFHNVSVERSYSFQFQNPANNYSQFSSAAVLSLTQNLHFATLVLKFNSDISFSSIELRFQYLHGSEVVNGQFPCAPYVMKVYKAGSRTDADLLGTVNASVLGIDNEDSIAGSVNAINGTTTYRHQGTSVLETRRIVDFLITVDGTNAIAGTYNASIYCVFTVGS